MTRHPSKYNAAFTLLELLVVIAIIGILTALSIAGAHAVRYESRRIKCANNLRVMALAAIAYEAENGEFPPAYERDFSAGTTKTWESCLWDMGTRYHIHQCPEFDGEAMWANDRYTGYNYNASYIGGRVLIRNGRHLPGSIRSADMSMIRDPSRCALFGDGEYASGANKFMRSPKPGDLDTDGSLAKAGTQGFRHRGKANVAFADAHVESLAVCYGPGGREAETAPGCGFLSPDNSLYDLE